MYSRKLADSVGIQESIQQTRKKPKIMTLRGTAVLALHTLLRFALGRRELMLCDTDITDF